MSHIDDARERIEQQQRDEEIDRIDFEADELDWHDDERQDADARERMDGLGEYGYGIGDGDVLPWGFGY